MKQAFMIEQNSKIFVPISSQMFQFNQTGYAIDSYTDFLYFQVMWKLASPVAMVLPAILPVIFVGFGKF